MPIRRNSKSRDPQTKKALLRKKLRDGLAALPASARRSKSKKILECLLQLSVYRKAKNIVIYASLQSEVATRSLIRRALSSGKNVFLPRVNRKRNDLEIFQIWNPSRGLVKGRYGVREPRPAKSSKGSPQNVDLVILPGLGFDKGGARLGRGEGYFDRFLKKTTRAAKIGLAFQEQMVKKIPTNSRDVRVDKVITD